MEISCTGPLKLFVIVFDAMNNLGCGLKISLHVLYFFTYNVSFNIPIKIIIMIITLGVPSKTCKK